VRTTLTKIFFRHKGLVLVGIVGSGYLWLAFFGPQGVQAWIDKQKQIRQLQEQNANLKLDNERRREHIRRLKESRTEQEMEIRRQLKLLRPGETTFLLPEPPKDQSPKDSGQDANNTADQ
jgi:cell division protein FtsB